MANTKVAKPAQTKPDTAAEKKKKKNSQVAVQPSQQRPFPIVGIGASAGGLEAYE